MDCLHEELQDLPMWLLEPLRAGALNLREASEIWFLTHDQPPEWIRLPDLLFEAAERLWLWEMATLPTVH